jgi:hypothetical protein
LQRERVLPKFPLFWKASRACYPSHS